MQKIRTHLWYDKEAKEAAEFYTSIFPNSKITNHNVLKDTPSGDCDVMSFEIDGHEFMAISAGPYFKFTPAISLMVNFDPSKDTNAEENLNRIWKALSEGGTALMPLDTYPFSKRCGWIQDKYGLSWQLILTNPEGEERPFIVPSFLFTESMAGKAEEASNYYISIFKNSRRGALVRYPAGMEPDKEGTIMLSDFMIENQWFVAMDGGGNDHRFKFNEAVSLMVQCEDQKEIDYFWEKLSANPENEQCGWCKDKYGVSWQITPAKLDEFMGRGTEEQKKRVTEAFLKMKKFDLGELERAYQGK